MYMMTLPWPIPLIILCIAGAMDLHVTMLVPISIILIIIVESVSQTKEQKIVKIHKVLDESRHDATTSYEHQKYIHLCKCKFYFFNEDCPQP